VRRTRLVAVQLIFIAGHSRAALPWLRLFLAITTTSLENQLSGQINLYNQRLERQFVDESDFWLAY
jgi:hypothetical protein